jgi:hypothetical protein
MVACDARIGWLCCVVVYHRGLAGTRESRGLTGTRGKSGTRETPVRSVIATRRIRTSTADVGVRQDGYEKHRSGELSEDEE